MVVITGIGLVSALGKSLEESWQQLIAGKSGIILHQPFPELKPLPLGMIEEEPARLRTLTQLVVSLALQDANLLSPLVDCGVVIGSSRSNQGLWEQMAREMREQRDKSPSVCLENWLETLPHMNAITVARQIGSCGTVLAPMAACSTGIWAIAQAVNLIQTGQCQRAIAGAVEAPITPLTLTGFQQMGALAKTGVYPFDFKREGLALAEGGAVFVLESEELAKQRQAMVYGQILGFGLTADAYHANVPEPEGRGAKSAIAQCLNRASLTFNDIDYIHAHGTATQMNDRIESEVIQQLFPQGVAVSSTKGSTGHTLGASGALGIAFSLMALQHQILPPCVGLSNSEFDLDLVKEVRQSKIHNVLCLSFGFGGQNAVMALGMHH
ncbi:3-oxoacyl-ACP synthase [Scytonema hofmannii PCC 7110]|uniref:3-oxoacyl-ACP synthase n=1 Tax=Scytonema hofmannii PCC 7110 TaxID=128403 RepID=A0A139XFX3_9CYAN|nr:beta-ketoacyl-ACP synthase [Scytonema hofmannii]KYC43571.1 3-oxoacyl-ACP synthase [Scytonema hofmannii PCC 7110]